MEASGPPDPRPANVLLWVALLAFAWAVIASAWVCDDAWITFRTLENAAAGLGLRYNTAERVQGFTHPLWALALLPPMVAGAAPYPTSLALSLACTAGAIAVLVRRIASGPAMAGLAVAALASSKASVDYATSGLENPLVHLLLALCLAEVLGRRRPEPPPRSVVRLAFWTALLATARLDAALLVAPALAHRALRARSGATVAALALGALPFLAWEVFAIAYYGFAFPNTAWAKLGAGVPAGELVRQGLAYLLDPVRNDPVTALLLVAGPAAALALRLRGAGEVALGIALALAYVVWIGGDFMAGRMLAAPAFAAAALVAAQPLPAARSLRVAAGATTATVLLGLAAPHPALLAGPAYGVGWPVRTAEHGIVDERAAYYPVTGAWRVLAHGAHPSQHPWAERGIEDRARPSPVLLAGPVGLYGYYVGPGKHVVDDFGLVDPLLARLPVRREDGWRPGHFPRRLPLGYYETLASGRNRIEHAALARHWEELALVTRGPLWSAARWRAIGRLNRPGRDRAIAAWLRDGAPARRGPSTQRAAVQ